MKESKRDKWVDRLTIALIAAVLVAMGGWIFRDQIAWAAHQVVIIAESDNTVVGPANPLPVDVGAGVINVQSGLTINGVFQFTCGTTALALTSLAAKRCVVVAMDANTVPIYWGTSGAVTTANGAELTRNSGDVIDVSANCSEIFCISANAAGEKVSVRGYN